MEQPAVEQPALDQIVRPFDSVTVFGGATLDRVAQSSAPPVMGASNPGTVRRIPGGVGLNVAMVLARLGVPTRLVARVGADLDGNTVTDAARAAGVDTSGLTVSAETPTAGYHATLDEAGGLIIGIADMKICDEMAPATLGPAAGASGERDFWIVDANLPVATLAFLVEEASASRRDIAALTVSPAKAVKLVPMLDRLSYLVTNRREAAALLGRDPNDPSATVARLATELAARRGGHVVVTNGAEPLSAAASTGEVRSYAPLKVAVAGVNGAGDSFAAGVVNGLWHNIGFNDAIRFGLAAAALTLESGSVLQARFSEDAIAERMGGRRAPAVPA
jgi:sugar/nucleoside kinase (ribokinase family)